MEKCYADLHVHTNFSDSTFSPEEVARVAGQEGLSVIAITDHDCVDGIEPVMLSAREYGIEVVPGIELTVDKDKSEIHILGFFIDYRQQWLKEKVMIIQQSRVDRIYKMAELLNKQSIPVNAQDILKLAGRGTVGRLHVASVMLKTGKVRTIYECFDKYIGYNKSCYVPHMRFSPEEAINMVLEAKGVPVLAHPATMKNDAIIKELAGVGLKGIEVFHSDHNSSASKKYSRIAREHGLLMTGGSDCHGLGKGRILLGSVKIDCSYVEELRKEAEKIRQRIPRSN